MGYLRFCIIQFLTFTNEAGKGFGLGKKMYAFSLKRICCISCMVLYGSAIFCSVRKPLRDTLYQGELPEFWINGKGRLE
ncbi:hypothetical protein EDM60_10190 [Brevibacillus parabrevis]|nr:hypothetical protein EDM60_10190 [Brevibacillus parabrevis]